MSKLSPEAQPYFLRSSRLGFRVWREEDLSLATALWGDPAVMEFIDSRRQLTQDQVKEILDRYRTMQQKDGVQYWPIFLLRTDEHVGCCGLRPYDIAKRVYEIGAHIKAAWWRQGLAEEAARAVIKYAFDILNASALFAGHSPKNIASQKLLRKLGFRFTGTQLYPATRLQHLSYILTP